jgi:hypothetical protein
MEYSAIQFKGGTGNENSKFDFMALVSHHFVGYD